MVDMGYKSKSKAIADGVVRRQDSFNSLVKQLEEPRSFLNLLTPEAQACILEMPEEYLNLDEEEYCQKFKFSPTPTDEALRVNFWMEMDRVKATKNELMNMAVVYHGVCSEQKFWNIIEGYRFDNSMKRGFVNWKPLGYLLTRPVQYEAMMLSLLNISTKKLRDVLSIPLKKENGDLQDPKVIDLILKASAMVDLRVRGNYINRSETKNLTMLESKSSIETKNYTTILTSNGTKASAKELEKSIDDQIKEIEKQIAGQDALPDPSQMPKPFPAATLGNSPDPQHLSSDAHADSGDDIEAEFKKL